MKKFREVLAEAKDSGDDHHSEAGKIVRSHSKGVPLEKSHDKKYDDFKYHIGAVHPDHVSKLHSALESAGFKKHEGLHGMSNGQGGHKGGHKFTKGKTTVHVSGHKDTWGKGNSNEESTHHSVEVHTEGKKKD